MDVIIPVLILAVAVPLSAWICYTFWSALPIGSLRLRERWHLSQKQRSFKSAEQLASQAAVGELSPACLTLFKHSFCVDRVFLQLEDIETLHHHHQALVARLIEVVGATHRDLSALEVVEDLLVDRDGLLRELADTHRAKGEIIRKQKEKGKQPPDWAIGEFERKFSDLHDQLHTNSRSLASKVEELFHALSSRHTDSQVVYH